MISKINAILKDIHPFVMMVAAFWLMVLTGDAKAHDWYPPDCCSGQDCAPAKLTWLPDGSIHAQTKHGTTIFPPNFPYRVSKDGGTHACFNIETTRPICLFLGGMTRGPTDRADRTIG
jgi:hypothetical protein